MAAVQELALRYHEVKDTGVSATAFVSMVRNDYRAIMDEVWSPPLKRNGLQWYYASQSAKFFDHIAMVNLWQCFRLSRISQRSCVTTLARYMSDHLTGYVVRTDISRFFETTDREMVLRTISNSAGVQPLVRRYLDALDNYLSICGFKGCPRGLAVSTSLTEIALMEFDLTCRDDAMINLYLRYVDDIVVVTRHNDFVANIDKRLSVTGNDYVLNERKTIVHDLSKSDAVEYLGYIIRPTIVIKKKEIEKSVIIDISTRKVQRICVRMNRSLLDYHRNGDWQLLYDRARLLSRNYFVRGKDGVISVAGMHYSNLLVTNASDSINAKNAEATRREMITWYAKSGNRRLTYEQQQKLYQCSVADGLASKHILRLSPHRIQKALRVW